MKTQWTRLRARLRPLKQDLRLVWYRHIPMPSLGTLGPSFGREAHSVRAGISTHLRKTKSGEEIFELRRRVHMLEKGLTMRPRRDTFAVDYIEATVRRLEAAWRSGLMDDEMVAWARDVLDEYFAATSQSASPQISRARERYAAFVLESASPFSGPAPVGQLRPDVSAPDLFALVAQRRSVRWFLPERVEREVVDLAIATALEAPTACNRVPYRFEVFDDPADAAKVAALAGGTGGYVQNLTGLIVVIGDHSAFIHPRDRHLIYIDGSLAAMSLILGFEAAGVATCCINWPDLKGPERAMRKLLGLHEWERPVMLLAYGYADPDGLAPASPKRSMSGVRTFRKLT